MIVIPLFIGLKNHPRWCRISSINSISGFHVSFWGTWFEIRLVWITPHKSWETHTSPTSEWSMHSSPMWTTGSLGGIPQNPFCIPRKNARWKKSRKKSPPNFTLNKKAFSKSPVGSFCVFVGQDTEVQQHSRGIMESVLPRALVNHKTWKFGSFLKWCTTTNNQDLSICYLLNSMLQYTFNIGPGRKHPFWSIWGSY